MLKVGALLKERRRWVLAALVAVIVIVLTLVLVPWLTDDKPDLSAPDPGKPTGWSLEIDSLHINAPLRSISETAAGTLNPPANPREVGWWNQSAPPGSKVGQTIITGHTVHTGGGQLDHLGTIARGALIVIHDGAKTLKYRETRVETISKGQVAQRSVELFGQDDAPNRLVLITCSGWTGSGYLSNVFVYAEPVA
jgi:LPXTG-site transpeptidase (sortase) family protein